MPRTRGEIMKIDACLCDRCGALHPASSMQRTAHVPSGDGETVYMVIDHTDLELCPTCASTFNSLLIKFLEPK